MSKTRQACCERNQSFCQQRSLVARFKCSHRSTCGFFSFYDSILREQHSRTRFINLRAVNLVFKSRKEYLRSVEMIVCICKPLNLPEKKGEVVFDTSLITYVARLVKVI